MKNSFLRNTWTDPWIVQEYIKRKEEAGEHFINFKEKAMGNFNSVSHPSKSTLSLLTDKHRPYACSSPV